MASSCKLSPKSMVSAVSLIKHYCIKQTMLYSNERHEKPVLKHFSPSKANVRRSLASTFNEAIFKKYETSS